MLFHPYDDLHFIKKLWLFFAIFVVIGIIALIWTIKPVWDHRIAIYRDMIMNGLKVIGGLIGEEVVS